MSSKMEIDTDDRQKVREEVLKLMQEKDKIESSIKELSVVLNRNGVGMNDPLVDPEDFPLRDVDVYQVRHARQRIICLQNDHKALMKRIEVGLANYYDSHDSIPAEEAIQSNPTSTAPKVTYTTPIAFIKDVINGSPADDAGLRRGDNVIEFGSVNSSNYHNISDIADVIRHSEGVPINIRIKRDGSFLNKTLVPRRWAGVGLVGCNITDVV